MTKSSLLVTGASGQLGRRVVELLLAQAVGPVIAITRTPEKLADLSARGVDVRAASFDDEAGLLAASRGVGRALLVSTDALDVPGHRLMQHQRAVRVFEAAGVEHVVYTSLPNADKSVVSIAPDHAGTEAALSSSALQYTILRNNMYADLSLFTLPGAIASGRLVDSRGTGAVAYVTRDDCARAAAAALADRTASGRRTLDVTGPEALTSEQLAAFVAKLVGKPLEHVSLPVEALKRGMLEHGLPPVVADLYASFDVAIARGDLAQVSNTVQTLTGRAPQSMRDFLTAQRNALG